ncbi:MAG: single-stranded-DNA-specific exonuclease RecJ [Cyanobacteriota bacterium]|nr:single-stranded-DNA-specific exonuclease RecJ [Cyanobacteriota bacterium]
MPPAQWQISPPAEIPPEFLKALRTLAPTAGRFGAQLLWQRGIREPEQLRRFLDPDAYEPAPPSAFGPEMEKAVTRLLTARANREQVTIWGDFDADGITATSVLWEGLGQFIDPQQRLNYYIPHRLRESHGLNLTQLERLAEAGTALIVTCDTGSTNLGEIARAKELGIDLIITDHHTLPPERPNVAAILNSRYFAPEHPLAHLSGVAVAYKLVEGLYQAAPHIPQRPLEDLLDLVAIGLIADLVELKGDCRYLAQRGIQRLREQRRERRRPGVALLLEYCNRSGDRPTDISFGVGPRLNAISRIQGDARFGVELLTSRDEARCRVLAEETELANSRRKELQKTLVTQAEKQLESLDLSTTGVIILENPQWPGGILGLVAGRLAETYGRPAIVLSSQPLEGETGERQARGSARSAQGVNLYELLRSQARWLTSFGGHPLAAGLSLPLAHLPFFREAINQRFWQDYGGRPLERELLADLAVAVADLGRDLFQELKLLEPCGMGNPTPKLLVEKCYFQRGRWENYRDFKRQKVNYKLTRFHLQDPQSGAEFPGTWWGHEDWELPRNTLCRALVELTYNTHSNRYEANLIDFQPLQAESAIFPSLPAAIIDQRRQQTPPLSGHSLATCPLSWGELRQAYQRAQKACQPLVLAYRFNPAPLPVRLETLGRLWRQGALDSGTLQRNLDIKPPTAERILDILSSLEPQTLLPTEIEALLLEEDFQRSYFAQVPLALIEEQLQAS